MLKILVLSFIISVSSFAQNVIGPENYLVWSHDNLYTSGEDAPISRFDILVLSLDDSGAEPVLAWQNMISPADTGIMQYSVKIINVFKDIDTRGIHEITIVAFDIYGFSSLPSLVLSVTWEPATPSAAFELVIE